MLLMEAFLPQSSPSGLPPWFSGTGRKEQSSLLASFLLLPHLQTRCSGPAAGHTLCLCPRKHPTGPCPRHQGEITSQLLEHAQLSEHLTYFLIFMGTVTSTHAWSCLLIFLPNKIRDLVSRTTAHCHFTALVPLLFMLIVLFPRCPYVLILLPCIYCYKSPQSLC